MLMYLPQRREREMQQKLESKDEDTLEVKETYTSLHQEVESKTKKLKKVTIIYQVIILYLLLLTLQTSRKSEQFQAMINLNQFLGPKQL